MGMSGELDIRRAGLTIAEAVEELDRAGLGRLDAAALDAQFQAREALLDHVRGIWEALKADGENPAARPEYQPLAALLDILTSLGEHAAVTAAER
ncbi:hypothetical protein [Kitasatospora sp. NBC_00315]|uniref:hypothetical protein n=1 Tax=Kitasatospora sp. NBC_00315 TaxID=2975963 RepID=UPI003255920B